MGRAMKILACVAERLNETRKNLLASKRTNITNSSGMLPSNISNSHALSQK